MTFHQPMITPILSNYQPEPRVQILLSTWNGERWLNDLLLSLMKQSWQNWQLLIRDDGSSDRTLKLLQDWQKRHPKHIQLIDNHQRVGSQQSFSQLVEQSDADYLMFCDQDDVWLGDKISIQMQTILHAEEEYNRNTPILVHSDMLITDALLEIIHGSFWRLKRFNMNQSKRKYLVQNVVTGASCVFNKAAAQRAFPLSKQAMEHDRWLALVTAWFGIIIPVTLPLVKYRQHNNNQIGAFAKRKNIKKSIERWSIQAEYFLNRYKNDLQTDDYYYLAALAKLRQLQGWERKRHLLRHKIKKDKWLPDMALLLLS